MHPFFKLSRQTFLLFQIREKQIITINWSQPHQPEIQVFCKNFSNISEVDIGVLFHSAVTETFHRKIRPFTLSLPSLEWLH